jgi:hypothetical protein
MGSTLTEIFDRQNDAGLRNRVEAALLKQAATDIVTETPMNADYAKILLNDGTGQTEAQRVLRYLIGKYPDVVAPTDEYIEIAVAEVYPKL